MSCDAWVNRGWHANHATVPSLANTLFARTALGGSGPRVVAPLAAALAMAVWLLAGGPALAARIPGLDRALALDGLSGFMLLLFLLEEASRGAHRGPFAPGAWACRVAGTLLALAAADGAILLTGVALASGWRRSIVPVIALLAALAIPGGGAFADIRATGLDDAPRAIAIVAALLAARPGTLGTYLLLRLTLDLAGPMPLWTAGLVLLGGAALALASGWAASRTVVAAHAAAHALRLQSGLTMLGAGLVLAARATDQASASGAGFAVIWLSCFSAAAVLPLWQVVASIARDTTGSASLAAMAGILRTLRIGTPAALLAGLTLAAVPPGAGFMALWQAFQAIRLLPLPPLLSATIALALALAAGFAAHTALRLLSGLAGPPDTRATERPVERWIFVLTGLLATLAAVFPAALLVLAAPATLALDGETGIPPAPGYAPWAVAVLLAGLATAIGLALRHTAAEGHRLIAAAPPIMPTQPPRSLANAWPPLPLRRALRRAAHRIRAIEQPDPTIPLAGAFAVLLALLLARILA